MKTIHIESTAVVDEVDPVVTMAVANTNTRREFLTGAAAIGVTLLQPGFAAAAPAGAKSFTILHTNDMHASFIGMGPSADYTPFKLNDDSTRGGYARLASLIAQRSAARKDQGPVLVLDAGDCSMGTAFSAGHARDRR
jgi:5'-nucleotidase/UDP-sugar diphosphatase